MSDEAERWKEKYLKSIEQQDKLEKRWNARLDLLRRGLVRSSLAAEGADKAVDQCMKEMREVVRKDDMDAGLAALIPRLEKAVLDSEQRREQRVEQMGAALTALVAQLQTLPLPREVAKPLKRFAKNLEGRLTQARELPLLLSELSGLQREALSQLDPPDETARPGFLQRLFGGRETAETDHPVAAPAPADEPSTASLETSSEPTALAAEREIHEVAVEPAKAEPVSWQAHEPEALSSVEQPEITRTLHSDSQEPVAEPGPVGLLTQAASSSEEQAIEQAETAMDDQDAEAAQVVEDVDVAVEAASPDDEPVIDEEGLSSEAQAEEEGLYSLPSSPEPSYSSVAAHIEETLLGLLNDLTLPEHHRPQAEAMRVRLEHGLNWYELLPILDDLAVLMLAITNSEQHEFERYLKQLNERLASFQSNLQAATEDHAGGQSASREMADQLREHVGDLQSSVQEASDLTSLKSVLESRLEGLLSTMDAHQQQRDEREQEVASRLQSLAGRVASMEQEAIGFRANLEEQRQKALIDTLTGLPNRAAWNERLDHEIQQLDKHPSSLLLGILDLDHFKRINDGYGHLAGDKVLKIVASQWAKRLRTSDFIARFGGEEFVVLLPHTSMAEGLELLERLREAIERSPFHFKGEPVTITVSMGVTSLRPGERSDVALKRADQALYRAKNEGRNRIEKG